MSNKLSAETPRTDAVAREHLHISNNGHKVTKAQNVDAEHARTLERELTAAQIEEARHSLKLWFPNESAERKLFNRICDAARSETKLALESARLRDALEDMRDAMVRIQQWCEAYPIDVFTEPDWDKAHKVLTENGMTLDGISAANMRHVLSGVEKISAAALKGTP